MRSLLLPALLALCANGHASAQEPAAAAPAALPEADLLQLAQERNERLTVPVMIGDAGPFRFLIDTGAQATVLSRELANRLGPFERSPATLVGIASRVPIETVAIDGLGLGPRRINVARVALVEGRHIGGAEGVLGIDALQGRRVLIDFVERQMTIATPQEAQERSGYEIVVKAKPRHGQLIITDARIDGVRITVVIDTGAQISVGNETLARRLKVRAVDIAEIHDINGVSARGPLHVARSAKIGKMELLGFPIMITSSPVFRALELEDRPTLIIGMRELRLFRRIAIDFSTRRVLFDLPASNRDIGNDWAW